MRRDVTRPRFFFQAFLVRPSTVRPMTKQSPIQIYYQLCVRLRQRIEFAETIAVANAPDWQIAEAISLQGRKAIETVAHMCLVATEHGLGKLGIPKDVKKQWNAEIIFKGLKSKNLKVRPVPIRVTASDQPGIKIEAAGIPEAALTYDDLIEIYQTFHEGLHDLNPYRTPPDDAFYSALTAEALLGINKVRKCVWHHFITIKGQAFLVDLKNTLGVTAIASAGRVPPPTDGDR
jgi:hypothetical protein